mgnify:CR=1 FL=1
MADSISNFWRENSKTVVQNPLAGVLKLDYLRLVVLKIRPFKVVCFNIFSDITGR